ncbi:LuxR family transcriptional regulator [Bradyrhizobium ontarionense]|uniref:LuxR family transcriptional regulator n=1 Tax=Bradyrhizobium ontarionense TaxID=2898149 RepID=A0ABY3RD63_9BRAD|nr:LuxR family transcriptional regulator [Bradyrhizobium sp. A19]UFZ04932.1 LuxR family transcriptional regulator [Bradyrhizobium sp. A19]
MDDVNRLSTMCPRLTTARSQERLFEMVKSMLTEFGIDHFLYRIIEIPRTKNRVPVIHSSYPPHITKRYSEACTVADPVLWACSKSRLPIVWDDFDDRVAVDCFGYGTGIKVHGLSFPIRGPAREFAIFSAIYRASNDSLLRQYIPDLLLFAHTVHAQVLVLAGVEENTLQARKLAHEPPRITRRELQCLSLAADGLQNKQIAAQLGISERVVRAYFDSARVKLECENRTHVVSRAVALNLIAPKLGSLSRMACPAAS